MDAAPTDLVDVLADHRELRRSWSRRNTARRRQRRRRVAERRSDRILTAAVMHVLDLGDDDLHRGYREGEEGFDRAWVQREQAMWRALYSATYRSPVIRRPGGRAPRVATNQRARGSRRGPAR